MSRQREPRKHPKQGDRVDLFEKITLTFQGQREPRMEMFTRCGFRFTDAGGDVMLCIFEQTGLTHFFHWSDIEAMTTENLKPTAAIETVGLAVPVNDEPGVDVRVEPVAPDEPPNQEVEDPPRVDDGVNGGCQFDDGADK